MWDRVRSACTAASREPTDRTPIGARLQQINPDVETAHINPVDFTTRDKEQHTADKTFAESSVAGSPKVATNVALLLALRDLGRADPGVRVPPLLVIDSPLAGLGGQGLDHDTGLRLIDALIDTADDSSPDGYACQVIAATNDPLPHSACRLSRRSLRCLARILVR